MTEKFVGDAILAVFGIPLTHEDDPERGVRAALAAHERSSVRALGLGGSTVRRSGSGSASTRARSSRAAKPRRVES